MYGDYGMYDYGIGSNSSLGTGLGVISLILFLIFFAIGVFGIVCQWKIFKKAGKGGWESIIPIYNLVVLFEISNTPLWMIILFLIPIVNIVVFFMLYINLAKQFGKSTGFGIGLVILPIIFLPILAFGKDDCVDNSLSTQNSADGNNYLNNINNNINGNLNNNSNPSSDLGFVPQMNNTDTGIVNMQPNMFTENQTVTNTDVNNVNDVILNQESIQPINIVNPVEGNNMNMDNNTLNNNQFGMQPNIVINDNVTNADVNNINDINQNQEQVQPNNNVNPVEENNMNIDNNLLINNQFDMQSNVGFNDSLNVNSFNDVIKNQEQVQPNNNVNPVEENNMNIDNNTSNNNSAIGFSDLTSKIDLSSIQNSQNICPNCGNKYSDGDMFCVNCGSKLK